MPGCPGPCLEPSRPPAQEAALLGQNADRGPRVDSKAIHFFRREYGRNRRQFRGNEPGRFSFRWPREYLKNERNAVPCDGTFSRPWLCKTTNPGSWNERSHGARCRPWRRVIRKKLVEGSVRSLMRRNLPTADIPSTGNHHSTLDLRGKRAAYRHAPTGEPRIDLSVALS